MPKPRATRVQKQQARRRYEEDGLSKAAIGREFGFSMPTISNWVKQGGWVKAGSVVVSETVGADAVGMTVNVDTTASTTVVDDGRDRSEADLRDRLARLEARNRLLEDENKALKPTVDIGDYVTDRVQWLTDNSPEGEKYWLNRAEAQFKKDNMRRAKDGLPVFNISDHPELLDDLIVELKTKEMMANAQEPTEPATRRVKLLIMRNGMPTIEQIPMENQINNMAGSLADGIVRYTRKGFKLTDPFLCPRAGCFRPAQNDELGRWSYDGYCTEKHRREVEGVEKSPTIGLQTKDTILSGIG
jgi:transposase-like protein